MSADDARASRVWSKRREQCNGDAGMCNDDLFAVTHAPQQLWEQGPRVVRVVLGKSDL